MKDDFDNYYKPVGKNVILASRELKEERLNICKTCEHYNVAANFAKLCSECGCILQWKTWLKNVECPKGKW